MRRYRMLTDYAVMALVVVALCVYFGVRTENFLRVATFTTLANQSADALVLAVGMTFVLLIAAIDLSVGSVLALCGAVLGICLKDYGWPLAPSIAACIAAGALCGAFNGLVVVRWGVPSFIVTLGMMEMARGAAHLLTKSRTAYIGSSIEVIADIELLDLALPFFVAIVVMILAQIALSYTGAGRRVLAVGANPESARLSGINSRRVTLGVFVFSGICAAVAAVIYTARMGSADPNAGNGFELKAIAAVVVGGTSLMGGRGTVVGSLFGVLIMAILAYGLSQMGAAETTKRLVTGLVIVLAVMLDQYRQRLASGRPVQA